MANAAPPAIRPRRRFFWVWRTRAAHTGGLAQRGTGLGALQATQVHSLLAAVTAGHNFKAERLVQAGAFPVGREGSQGHEDFVTTTGRADRPVPGVVIPGTQHSFESHVDLNNNRFMVRHGQATVATGCKPQTIRPPHF